MLIIKTNEIKQLSLTIKSNFIQIGQLLTEIRDKKIYLEKYKNFTSYLNSEDFQFCKSMAYNLIDVYDKYSNVQCIGHIPLRTLIQLANVSDREIRHELEEEAIETYDKKQDIGKFYDKVKRANQRTKEEVNKGDNPEDKSLRQLEELVIDIKTFYQTKIQLNERVKKGVNSAFKYPNNEIIQGRLNEIKHLWRG